MVDRTDIDALLIGALYGELTPADEARLRAHLESHPADRTALDDLTRTRAAVRESRILIFQFEPRQAISALLLQEASRRAPRAVTDRGEGATWFQRFVRSFMAHPAMAAAATLVLVITAAGTLYLRGTDQFAKSEAPAVERLPAPAVPAATSAPSESAAAAPSPAPAAPMAAPVTSPAVPAPEPQVGAAEGSSAEGAAASDPYRFDGAPAATGRAAQDKEARQLSTEVDEVQDRGLIGRASNEKTKGASQGATQAELSKLGAATKAAPQRPSKPEPVRGIELRTPQLQPKDLGDDEKPAGRRERAAEIARDQRNAAAAGGAPATPPAAVPPPPPAPAPARVSEASRPAGPAGAADFDASQVQQAPTAPAAPASEAKRPSPKQSVQPLPPSSVNNAVSAQNDRRPGKTANAANADNTANGDSKQVQVLDWARKQREQVIAYVNANRCREAATTAVEIYNRAPEYYNANVATDRQIKPCLAYVTSERERADRSRASNKNAADVQTPAQAAPARK